VLFRIGKRLGPSFLKKHGKYDLSAIESLGHPESECMPLIVQDCLTAEVIWAR